MADPIYNDNPKLNLSPTLTGDAYTGPLPGEPFSPVSDYPLSTNLSSFNNISYAIEYKATGDRGEIINLKADTFKISKDYIQFDPSPSASDPDHIDESYTPGGTGISSYSPTGVSTYSTSQDQFISIDIQPVIASRVTESGDTIKNYTSFLSRPELWREIDPVNPSFKICQVTNLETLKHFVVQPPDEERKDYAKWPGTQIATAVGIITSGNKRRITDVVFSGDNIYKGDLIHDDSPKTAETTVIIPRNTRIFDYGSNFIELNADHTFVGVGSTTIEVKIRRIGPSGIKREYGYYFRHYDWEDGYYQGQGGNEHLQNKFTSSYSYAFYYGKTPDGRDKCDVGDATIDINGNPRYQDYNTTGRWGVYIDDEVKNYMEGRLFVGHNESIGYIDQQKPEPIVSIFNNKWKNQEDELDAGRTPTPSDRVDNPEDLTQFQLGLYVEDLVGIGTRPDTRYRLYVNGVPGEARGGILKNVVTRAARFEGDIRVTGEVIKGSGTFKIDHPLPELSETHNLVHSFVEGPRADLIYRGRTKLISGTATIQLDEEVGMTPGTWELLCRDPDVFVSNNDDWCPVKGKISSDGTLTITAKESTCNANVSWLVIAERQDKEIRRASWTDEEGRTILEPSKDLDS